MRIEEIAIEGFGSFRDARFRPAAGLTVIRGDNEAGKSTLLAFIRAMLFGFETDRYPALHGGRRGGALIVRTAAEEVFRVERHSERGGAGRLAVRDAAGADRGPSFLPRLLQGVEATLFRNVFAFGLEELAEFKRLTEGEVAARIYGAGLGTGAASALDVEEELRGEQSKIFLPSGERPRLNVLLRELDELDRRLASLDLPAEYGALRRSLAERQARVEHCQLEIRQLEEALRSDERLLKGWSAWLGLRAADAELARLNDPGPIQPDALSKHAQLAERLRQSRRAAAEITQRLQSLDAAIESIRPDETLLANGDAVESVTSRRQAYRALTDEVSRADARRATLRTRAEEAIARLGPAWDAGRVLAFDDSLVVRTALSGRFRSALEGAQREVERASDDLRAEQRDLAECERRLTDLDAQLATSPSSATPEAELDAREQQLRELETSMAELAALRSLGGAATSSRAARSGAPRRPLFVTPLVAALAVLAVGLGLAALMAATGAPFIVTVVVLAVSVLGAIAAWWSTQRRAALEPAAADAVGASTARQRIAGLDVAIDRGIVSLGLPSRPASTEIDALRRELRAERVAQFRRLAVADQRAGEERTRGVLRDRVAAAVAGLQAATAASDGAHAEWRAWLEASGLPGELDRESAIGFVEAIDAARSRLEAVADSEREVTGLRARLDEYNAQAGELARTLGRAAPPPEAIASELDSLGAELDAAREAAAERARLAKERDEVAEAHAVAVAEVEEAEVEYRSLLAASGVADEDELRARVALLEERRRLEAEQETGWVALMALSGPGEALASFERALEAVGDISQVERRLTETRLRLETLTRERDADLQAIGAARDSIAVMESSVEASDDRQRRSDLLARVASEVERWSVLALAGALLRKTRDRFEREHRPAVIASAEDYLGAWTSGRYVRIIAPVGRQIEALERSDGSRVPLAGLSRGTAEQLYLALRFGLVERFAAEAEPLPILMDEILVNFDDGRARAAARSIEELSRSHQVLYFTCAAAIPLAADLELSLDRAAIPIEAEPQDQRTTVHA